jgi:hypothetical protein
MVALADAIDTLPTAAQHEWETFCRERRMTGVPARFSEVVAKVRAFADPLLAGTKHHRRWDPKTGWRP